MKTILYFMLCVILIISCDNKSAKEVQSQIDNKDEAPNTTSNDNNLIISNKIKWENDTIYSITDSMGEYSIEIKNYLYSDSIIDRDITEFQPVVFRQLLIFRKNRKIIHITDVPAMKKCVVLANNGKVIIPENVIQWLMIIPINDDVLYYLSGQGGIMCNHCSELAIFYSKNGNCLGKLYTKNNNNSIYEEQYINTLNIYPIDINKTYFEKCVYPPKIAGNIIKGGIMGVGN